MIKIAGYNYAIKVLNKIHDKINDPKFDLNNTLGLIEYETEELLLYKEDQVKLIG